MRRVPILLAAFLAACSSASGSDPGVSHGGDGDGGVLAPDGDTPDGGAGGSTYDAAPGDAGGAPAQGEVYAHSDTVLYKLEPISKSVTTVGAFDCVTGSSGMWDIALDKDGNMFGSVSDFTSARLVAVQKSTAHCETIATASSLPNSLTFVPAGILDPNDEVLVGFDQTSYVRIDKATGAVQQIGDLNPNPTNQMWESSGDVVSIIGDKTYLTVKPWQSGLSSDPDYIVEINPQSGQVLKLIGQTGFPALWGLGYWGGVAYGFSETGQLCEIDLTTGAGAGIPLSGMPSGLSFWGAGVTTAAPIEVPK